MELYVNCKCGKKAYELDYSCRSTVDKISSEFGSIDDHYFFICECGEWQAMHYTGYDCLLEEFEYVNGLNETVKVLLENGSFNFEIITSDKIKLENIITGYDSICEIDSYEYTTFYRKGYEFYKVNYNSVHKTYELFKYKAKENNIVDLYNYFKGN